MPPHPAVSATGSRAGIAAFAALIACVAYTGTLFNAPVWDDADLVVDNPFLASWDGVRALFAHDLWTATARHEPSSFYRPLPMATYALNRLFGAGAASYHAGEVLLHAACVALVVLLAAAQATRGRRAGAVIAGLVFALAPVNVEAVAWMSARFDLLGTALVLGALVANGRSGWRASSTAVLGTCLALLCKESFIVALPLLFAHDVLLMRRRVRDVVGKHAACLVGAAAFFALRRWVGVVTVEAVEHTGAVGLLQGYAFLLAALGRALVFPAHLDPFRAYHAPTALAMATTSAVAAALVVLPTVLVRRRPDDARARAVLFGFGWALVALLPGALTGPNLGIVGDRYAYFPMAGVAFALAALADAASPHTARGRAFAGGLVAYVLAVFGGRTAHRVGEWRDERTLYARSVADDPENAYALYMLGALHAHAGELDAAEPLLVASLARGPRSWRANNAMCVVRLRQRRLDEAEAYCRASAEVHPANPRVWSNLASVHVARGMWRRALAEATRATELGPYAAEAHYLRAAALANTGDLDGARAEIQRTLELDPRHRGAADLLAQLRARGL